MDIMSMSRKPLYWRVAEAIKANIDAGKYKKGELLPSERDISTTFDVSRITVRKALAELIDSGVIKPHKRLGYEVLDAVGGVAESSVLRSEQTEEAGDTRKNQQKEENEEEKDLLMCLPFYSNHFHGNKLLENLERVLVRKPYRLIIRNTQESPETEVEILKKMEKNPPKAVLYLPSGLKKDEYNFDFSSLRTISTLIFVDRYVMGVDAHFIGTNNILASRTAVERLVARGHRRIAFVGYKQNSAEFERFTGYKMGLELADIPIDEDLIGFEYHHKAENSIYEKVGKESVQKMYSLSSPPTAFICLNDFVASGIYAGLKDLGVAVPEEASIIGFDDDPIAQSLIPGGFATFVHDHASISRAILTLLEQGGDDNQIVSNIFPAEFHEKGSFGDGPHLQG